MKDAIIVRKVTGPFSHERKDWRRRNEETTGTIFDYSVTDPRNCFSRRKNHDTDQKTRAEDNNHFFKESHSKIRRRDKKRTSSLFEKTWKRNRRFCEGSKSKSRIRSDWLGSDEMEWWRTDNSWILNECLWRYKSYWRIGLESRYPNKWWQYIEYRWDVYRIRHWYRGKIIWVIGI